jgi:hypothetical protein
MKATELKELPSLFGWSLVFVDQISGIYTIYAAFLSVDSKSTLEELFKKSIARGFKGTISIEMRAPEFARLVKGN